MYRHGTTCLPVSEDWKRATTALLGEEAYEVTPGGEALGEGMRWELIQRIRSEIEAGTYETPERWETALERLAESLGSH